MKFINRLDVLIITLIGLSMVVPLFQPGFQSMAAGNAVTTVSASAQSVNSGQQFTVSINIQPNNPIAGAQCSLTYNPTLVSINNIAEGNLLNGNGAGTYFMPGTINNTAGTVTGIAGAIIGSGNTVSAAGTFAVITMTAHTTGGTCPFNLNNVIIANSSGQSVPVTPVNGQVVINGATTTTTTTTTTTNTTTTTTAPPPPSGGSGGGGGGGGFGGGPVAPASVAGVTDVSNVVNVKGIFSVSVSPWSDDKKIVLVVNTGTTALTSAGAPLTQISIQHMNVAPAFAAGAGMVSLGYNFLPSDATINPSSVARFQYDPVKIPEGVEENSLLLAYYDTSLNKWISLPSDVDTLNHFITAQISRFSFYAVTYGIKNAAPALTTTAAPTVSSTVTTSTAPARTSTTVTSTTTLPEKTAATTLTETTSAAAVIPVSTTASSTTTTTQAPRVVRLSLLAITIGVDVILIAGVVVILLLIRRSMLKNSGGKQTFK